MRIANVILTLVSFLVVFNSEAKACSNVVVSSFSMDYIKVFAQKEKKYIIKENIDLGGRKIVIGDESILVFQGGSLKNGLVIGNNTRIKETKKNIFHNCIIEGTWRLDYSFSSMFDSDIDAILLFKNLSKLSPNIKLYANRKYIINKQNEAIEVRRLEAAAKEKPRLEFHTTNPDVCGILLIGEILVLKNLIICDDYNVLNDVNYGPNNPLIGNTIEVSSKSKIVQSLTIEGCNFTGATSSSFVASSQTINCMVKGCTFSGYMADHGVYCSMKAENFKVENCTINDVTQVSGLFKVRSSNRLRQFCISDVKVHNYNGYLAMVSLLETPNVDIVFEKIKVTKDADNNSVFYGFCLSDETKQLRGKSYNAHCIIVSKCQFEYGYGGNAVIYPGAGERVCAIEIKYEFVNAKELNFGGGYSDRITVNNSEFESFCGDKGIHLFTKELVMKKCNLSNNKPSSCLFLVNYDNELMHYIKLQDVKIDADTDTIISIIEGEQVGLRLKGCIFTKPPRDIYRAPKGCHILL